jgi:methyl halide transferase
MTTNYWHKRYEEGSTGWDIGAISTPLKEYIDQLENRNLRILIPGSGFGHEALYLAQKGFNQITVIDLVDEALENLRENVPDINAITGDFFQFHGTFDLILEQTLFCAIDPSLRDTYLQHISNLLPENGKYVGVLFNREFEGGPPFGGSTEEYTTYFDTKFRLVKMEDCYNSIPQREGTEVFVIAIR